jgi:endonuclease/exonuclease/phosphatase family metal-dependent hydrolase
MRLNAVRVCTVGTATCVLLTGAGFGPAESVQAQTAATLKVMDWNIQHGEDMSGANNLDRVATWIKNINAHVVSLNEVEKQNGYNDNADEPAVLESLLESKTGVPWYGCFAQIVGAASGQGNLVLSRIRIEACDRRLLSAERSVARATLTLNGTRISVFSTHLDDASASMRATQVAELTSWAATAPEQRIIMGDLNAGATSAELQALRAAYQDAWPAAVAAGTAVSYPGNTAGNTRNSRIDYIWRSNGATKLSLQSAQVYDTGSVSDHRPVAATYAVTTTTTMTLQAPRRVRIVAR